MDNLRRVSITDFNAIGDGISDSTSSFSEALKGGNVILSVPKGVYLTGPITLLSNTTLIIEGGATIRFIDDPNLYKPVYTRWEGVMGYAMHPCLYSEGAKNITICGNGTIDGNGEKWWKGVWERKEKDQGPTEEYEKRLALLNPDYLNQPGGGGGRKTQFLRPSLVEFNNCDNVVLKDVTLLNSPFWTLHPLFSRNVEISGIKINNPPTSPNTDAIDIDSSSFVHVDNCFINVGDDGICLKSGAGEDGIKVNKPTFSVLIENCTVRSAHGGAVIGSETAAGIHDCIYQNCNFIGTDRGIRVKTRRGRGGEIKNLRFSNINIESSLCPIAFNMYYKCGATDNSLFSLNEHPVTETTPKIENILIEGVKASDCKCSAGFFVGLPESTIKSVVLRNSSFAVVPSSLSTDLSEMFIGLPHVEERGLRVRNADLKMENVEVFGVEKEVVKG